MSNVKPIAKFKADDLVMMLEATYMPGDDGEENVYNTVIQTKVVTRHFTSELGWLYCVLGYVGFIKEDVLKPYDESQVKKTLEGDGNGAILDQVDPKELQEAQREQVYQIGQYARTMRQVSDHTHETEYLLIIGCLWDVNSINYDCAYLTKEGKWLDHQDGYFEDELTPVSDEEMAEIIQERVNPRPRPKLMVVHSR